MEIFYIKKAMCINIFDNIDPSYLILQLQIHSDQPGMHDRGNRCKGQLLPDGKKRIKNLIPHTYSFYS